LVGTCSQSPSAAISCTLATLFATKTCMVERFCSSQCITTSQSDQRKMLWTLKTKSSRTVCHSFANSSTLDFAVINGTTTSLLITTRATRGHKIALRYIKYSVLWQSHSNSHMATNILRYPVY